MARSSFWYEAAFKTVFCPLVAPQLPRVLPS
jgi:hypothetical protein